MKKLIAAFVLAVLLSPSVASATVKTLYLRTDSTGPYYYAQIVDQNGSAVDISGATLTAYMRSVSGSTNKVNGTAMVISDGVNGYCEYQWSAADTDTAGTYAFQIRMLLGGVTYYFPSRGLAKVVIEDLFGF